MSSNKKGFGGWSDSPPEWDPPRPTGGPYVQAHGSLRPPHGGAPGAAPDGGSYPPTGAVQHPSAGQTDGAMWLAFITAVSEGYPLFLHNGMHYSVKNFAEDYLRRLGV